MTKEERILVDKFLDFKKTEDEARRNIKMTLGKLEKFAPHKVGEIVRWTEHKRKNIGSMWHPNFIDLPPVEKMAVVTSIEVNVWKPSNKDACLDFRYEFRPIKKDGSISQNQCYPHNEIKWTGEIHEINK